MIITSFTDFHKGIDEAPRNFKGRELHKWILKNLRNRGRISCFEISENYRVCRALMFLKNSGKVKLDGSLDYPYVGVEVL